jgi:hypothetical protein
MTSSRSASRISLLAPDSEFGKDDLIFLVGAGNVGGAWTG